MSKIKTICCRVTQAQYDSLMKLSKKSGNKSSECVRRILDSYFEKNYAALENKEIYIQRKELKNEINHIGNNINQIAHNTNMGIYSEYEKRKLFAMMNELKKLLEEKL